jgi:transcriptional antiterminator NusG
MTPAGPFTVGDAVRVIDGPFVDLVGIVRTIGADTRTVTVDVAVKGRDITVELDWYRIERVR